MRFILILLVVLEAIIAGTLPLASILMSVSSVSSGFPPGQAASKGAISQPAAAQETPSVATEQNAIAVKERATESATVGLGGAIPHANRVGVAAYIAIMNPQIATSMRAEA